MKVATVGSGALPLLTGSTGSSGTGSGLGGTLPAPSITVEEIDGSPLVTGVTTIKVSNGTLTDNTGGVVTITTSGASSLTVEEVDGSPTDSAVTKIVFPNGTLGIASHVATYTPAGGGGGPTDYVSGASGTGQIIIPGLAGDADIRVAGTNDDEFDTTDTTDPMTGWTTLGTPTTHNINSQAKSNYYISKTAAAGNAWVGIYKAIPATPFTVTCKVTDAVVRSDVMSVALMVLEASPGKLETLVGKHDTGDDLIGVDNWTNRTTFSSSPVTGIGQYNLPMWFRCVVTTTTNIAWYFSMNGLSWRLLVSGRNPGFTVGAVGLGINNNNASNDMTAFFDWIRFT